MDVNWAWLLLAVFAWINCWRLSRDVAWWRERTGIAQGQTKAALELCEQWAAKCRDVSCDKDTNHD